MQTDILFISTNDWVAWGGSEVLWSRTALLLRKKEPSIGVSACLKRWDPVPQHVKTLESAGVKILYKDPRLLPAHKRYLNRVLPTANQFRTKNFFSAILALRPRLVVFSLGDQNEAPDLIEFIKKENINYALIIQLAKEGQIERDEFQQIITQNYLTAEKVYFVSHQNKKILEVQMASKLPNAEVISNPFPFSQDGQNLAYPDSKNGLSLAFVASLSANHKGHDLLFQVLSDQKWRSRNLFVNLYGKGPHAQYLRDLQKFYGLSQVNFAGFSNSAADIWKHNHGAILCSRMEGQSLALLEAMSYNRMPVVTDVGDARELIQDGVNGFIADAPSVKHIDEALERAWEKRTSWESMGAKAGSTLRSLRSEDPIEVFAKKIMALVNK